MSQPVQPRAVLHLPKVRMLSRGGRPAVRISNVQMIMPPTVPNSQTKKRDAEKTRTDISGAEAKKETKRSRVCQYSGYECWGSVVSGRQYCAAHILQDSAAPFAQCAHSYSNGDRCPQPAPAAPGHRDPPLCFEHARAALLSRQRAAAPPPPVTSTETLLNQLQHYVKPERPRTTSCASSVSVVSEPSEPEQISPIAVDPFKQMDATTINNGYASSILECASCSDSEGENITLGPEGNCRLTQCSSDTEDATVEDSPLWRAGVYAAEEAVTETHAALRALQGAYMRQMDRLKHLLQTARLNYLRDLKQEKEQYCSINSQARSGPLNVRERKQLRKLKAYAGYHRKHGVEAVLARKLHKKRAKVNDSNANRPIPSAARCTFVEETVRCASHSVPASKHCARHILHDRNQVLFSACSDVRGVAGCREPVARLPLPSDACRYHTDPPAYTVFTLKKDETDSETDSQTSFAQLSDEETTPTLEVHAEPAPDP